jgi:carbonic anhydrase
MTKLVSVTKREDIFPQYRGTPIGLLIEYHNLGRAHDAYENAPLLIGMCMDNRKHLHIPDNFAYIIRSGGADLRQSEFKVSYAIAVGGVKAIALIGHNQCGMVNLAARRDQFIAGMIENGGWTRQQAEDHFERFWPTFEISNELDFVVSEAQRLRAYYPKVQVAPMIYLVEDGRIYLVNEDQNAAA